MRYGGYVYILASGRAGTLYIGVTNDWNRDWKLNLIECENSDWSDLALAFAGPVPS